MFRLVGLCVVSVGLVIFSSASRAQEGFKFENKPANLQAYIQQLHQLAHIKKDVAAANKMFRALLPDEARAKAALRDEAAGLAATIADAFAKAPPSDLDAAKLGTAAQTKVAVYGATTEDLIKYAAGSVAAAEFPSKVQDIAPKTLRPGVTFYEVELTEPSKDFGVKLHLLYWDGKQWSMLGSVWRMVK